MLLVQGNINLFTNNRYFFKNTGSLQTAHGGIRFLNTAEITYTTQPTRRLEIGIDRHIGKLFFHLAFQGQSPYSATKIGADRLAESFYRSFDLPVTIVRPFNTYGPRQSGRAIIPTIITQLLAGQTEIKLGSLTPTRDFNYVKDTANGFMTIADCDAAIGQELNIATGVEHSIGDLANELIAQINPNAKIVCEAERLRPEKSEVNRLLGDSTKLRNLTGWAPQYTFEQGLAATIEFLRGNLDQYKVGQYIL